MSESAWKKGHVWTKAHLDKQLRLVEVRNFAKRKMAGLEDDVHDLYKWSPPTDDDMKSLVLDDDSWVPYECELCGKVATWKKIGVGDFCDRCKEDWPDD